MSKWPRHYRPVKSRTYYTAEHQNSQPPGFFSLLKPRGIIQSSGMDSPDISISGRVKETLNRSNQSHLSMGWLKAEPAAVTTYQISNQTQLDRQAELEKATKEVISENISVSISSVSTATYKQQVPTEYQVTKAPFETLSDQNTQKEQVHVFGRFDLSQNDAERQADEAIMDKSDGGSKTGSIGPDNSGNISSKMQLVRSVSGGGLLLYNTSWPEIAASEMDGDINEDDESENEGVETYEYESEAWSGQPVEKPSLVSSGMARHVGSSDAAIGTTMESEGQETKRNKDSYALAKKQHYQMNTGLHDHEPYCK
ncbi:unnamed protein product [Protopolystoma xenopodis]|uniref:Uncharacterized protein n=1 Tax=Protopolystoma xenopodis TaxID=117903 RepID=A0A448WB66_9PLAT|nr:unnamed protein product [Protopolystoma xenopodis]